LCAFSKHALLKLNCYPTIIYSQKLKRMKKFLTIAFAGAAGIFSSCNNNTAGGSQGEKNIAIVHSINDAIESGDVSKLDQYIATDAVDHSGEHGEVNGLDSIKAHLKRFHDEYPDMKLEEQQDAANGDYVFSLTRFTGTNVVPSMGAPAGTHFDMAAVEVVKCKDGKVTDHWEYMTMADMMKMMGGSNMGMDNMGGKMESNKMDTTKH
jgi:predicted ester cyclase